MKPALIVHGGAWDWDDSYDEPKAAAILKSLEIGWAILNSGGSALDAVEKAVNHLEDEPLFDAGVGSHLNAEGVVEMDAIIVDGARHDFGAVAGVQRVRYPVTLARKVLEETQHNFFVGSGADMLAVRLGMPTVANLSLTTVDEFMAFKRHELRTGGDTVGAAALDEHGNIAVATSTGGTPLKMAGRVGDSPMFGAGAYAENSLGAASATGKGENCMRYLLSKYIVDQIGENQTAQEAADSAIRYIKARIERPMLGFIVVDAKGNVGAAHTTDKIAYGWIDENGQPQARMKAK